MLMLIEKETSVIFFISVLQVLLFNVESYDLKCPSQTSWKIRANIKCKSTLTYFCLYNNVEKKYVEGCKGPDWDRKGSKRIFSGSFTRENCKQERFQPFNFQTNESMSDCIYAKSLCTEKGQVIYNGDSTKNDRTCRCDYKKNYTFLKKPRHFCFCIPTEEDCSCYFKSCPVNSTLSADYSCTQSGFQEKTKCLEITEYNKTIDNKTGVCMDNTSMCISKTTYTLERRNTTIVYGILTCILGGAIFAVLLYIRTSVKLQTSKRYYIRKKEDADDVCVAGNAEVDIVDGNFLETCESTSSNMERIHLQTEEVYFLRMVHLLFRVACPVVRMTFNQYIQPNQLRKTLDKNKALLEKKYRKKEKIINDYQWNILYECDKDKTVTSDDFDIKLMIYLLRTIAKLNVSDLFSVHCDTRIEAMLTRVKYIRNEITRSVDGKLEQDQFNQYWDVIEQAVLTLVTPYVSDITNENKQINRSLMGRILMLKPIKIDKKMICIFIDMSEKYPAMILQQLFNEYCMQEKVTIEDILNEEKHQLYHKRQETEACCVCNTNLSTFNRDSTYFKCISEKQWESLYSMKYRSVSHVCTLSLNKCSVNFVPKQHIYTCDLSVTKVLILNIPKMLIYIMNRLCMDGFDRFLIHNQHILYHSMEAERCCKCYQVPAGKIIINKKEWNKLFIKNDTSCKTSCENCCCQYSVRSGIKYTDIDFIFLSKILHVAGPFGVLNKIEQNPYLYFLIWTADDEPLQGSLIKLLRMVKEESFFCEMLKRTSAFNHSHYNETVATTDDASQWIINHFWQHKATRDTSGRLFEAEKDGSDVQIVESRKDVSLHHRTRRFTDITSEENNFLVVVHCLTKLVYPVIQKEVATQSPDVLDRIYMEIYEQYTDRNDTNNSQRIYLTRKQREQLFSPKQLDSKILDLKLKIYLLKQSTEDKGQTEYGNQLDVIESIARETMQSSSGVLDKAKFRNVMERLRKAVMHFGGEFYADIFLQLQQMRNILE